MINGSDATGTIARAIRGIASKLRFSPERRKLRRSRAEDNLVCNLGAVIDLSTAGMRILAKRRLEGRVSVEVCNIHRGVTLDADVMWSKRLGFRRHEVGMHFPGVSPDVLQELKALSEQSDLITWTDQLGRLWSSKATADGDD